MDLHDVIAFANEHSACWLATASPDGVPHVRGMWMWFADEQGLVFHTGSTKSVAQELSANPRVEVAFFDPGSGQVGSGRMLRVAGRVQLLDDPELQTRLLAERSWLHGELGANPGVELVVFRVRECVAHLWSMAANLHEREQPRITFG